ncbi:unnamed protein product [Pylaiella littoralis]
MTSSNATKMEVESDNSGDPTPEQIMEIAAEETGQEIRRRIAQEVQEARRARRPNDPLICELLVPPDLANSTFRLPAVEQVLREFLPLEVAVNELLSPQINWAPPGYKPTDRLVRKAMARLWAIRTDGDGDCLLHSVSLSLWGQHDRTLVLRSLLVEILLDKPSEKVLFRTWREGQQRADAAAGGNASFEMEEEQVMAEWHMLVEAAKTPSAYLSSFHAFVLANALRRPILVYGDRFVRGKDGEPYAPSDVRGVYLPTILAPGACYKLPIAVGYTCVAVGKVGHFTALVGVDRQLKHLPLVDEHGDNLPIRREHEIYALGNLGNWGGWYGIPSATAARPDPEGYALENYMVTTPYYTEEDKQYRMAVLRGAYMTPEAEDICVAMALASEAAFDRLAKAQEQEINRALLASALPPPPPVGGGKGGASPDGIDAGGRDCGGGGNNESQPTKSPPAPPPPSNTLETEPSALAAASEATGGVSESLSSRLGSGNIAAGLFASDDFVKRGEGGAAGSSSTQGSSAVAALRGGAGRAGATAGDGEAPPFGGDHGSTIAEGSVCAGDDARLRMAGGYGDSGGASQRAGVKDGGGGGGGGGSGGGGRSGSKSTSATAGAPQVEETAVSRGAAESGGDGANEKVPGLMSPPISSRFLSAPFGMLSAVGAWATGLGRSSIASDVGGDAATAATAAAAAAAAPAADCDRNSSGEIDDAPPSDVGLASGLTLADASLLRESLARAESPPLPRTEYRTGGADDARPPHLKLDGTAQGAAKARVGNNTREQGGVSRSGRRPPFVHVAEDGMDVDSSPPKTSHTGEGSLGVGVVTNGKRKPVCSPAVTPDGPNSGQQHFGDTEEGIRPTARPAGAEDWRVTDPLAAKIPGSRRSKGRAATAAGQPPRRAAAVSIGTGGAAPSAAMTGRAGLGASMEEKDDAEEPCFVAYHIGEEKEEAAAAAAAAAAVDAYNATARWRAARSSHPSARGDSNPRVEELGQRTASATYSAARYHSQTRLPQGAWPPADCYGPISSGRVVRDGMETLSLDSTAGDKEGYCRRRSDSSSSSISRQRERVPHGAAAEAAAAVAPTHLARSGGVVDRDPYRHAHEPPYLEQMRAASSSAASSVRENVYSLPPREPLDYSLYSSAPPPASVAESRARRAASTSLSSSPFYPGGGSTDEGRGRRVKGETAAEAAGYSVGGRNGSYSFVGSGSSKLSEKTAAAAAAHHRQHGRDADRWEEKYANSRMLWSSSSLLSFSPPSSSSAVAYPARRISSSGGGGSSSSSSRRRSSSPAPFPSSTRKSGTLRRALEIPAAAATSLSSTATSGRESSWTTRTALTSSSYLRSELKTPRPATTAAGGGLSPRVPGAVARGSSARGRLTGGAAMAAAAGGSGGDRSDWTLRSSGGGIGPAAAAYGGQTLSSMRRTRDIQERRAIEAGVVGARASTSVGGGSRLRKAHANSPKFY